MIWNKPFFEKKEMQKEIKMLQALREECGAILVLTALLLPFLFGCVGIGYDVGTLYMHKARLQNVADAAALAGARAYLDSQTNEDGTEAAENAKDHIDENAGTGRDKEIYQLSDTNKTKDRTTSAHKKADEAADAYIYKNIVNLGGKVKSDEYSHYALQDENGVKYYRIGLEERVPLAFLPVITNTYERRVRAGAIALLSEGTPATVITQGWSLFDKLFTVQEKLEMTGAVVSNPDDNAINNHSSIKSTFNGDMVFTGDSWSSTYYWTQGHEGFYLYTDEEAQQQLSVPETTIHNLELIPNTGARMVHDTSIPINYYVTGFRNKLERKHIDLADYTLNTNNISNWATKSNQDVYVSSSNNGKYYHRNNDGTYKETTYNPCANVNVDDSASNEAKFVQISENKYEKMYTDGYFGLNLNHDPWYIGSNKYVLDSKGNRLFIHDNNGTRSFYRESDKKLIDFTATDTDNSTNYSYSDNGETISFGIDKISGTLSKYVDDSTSGANVYHLNSGGSGTQLNVNGGLDGQENNPIYIIVENGAPKIYVYASNQRPIIYCYFGTEALEVNWYGDYTFKGVIYTPNTHTKIDLQADSGAKFEGNIISKSIEVANAGANLTQKNFVALANDNDLNTVPDTIITLQKARKQAATNYAKTTTYLSSLIPEDAWSNPNWYSETLAKVSQEQINGQPNPDYDPEWVTKIREAWYNARFDLWKTQGLDMPDWPWTAGGKTTDKDKLHYIKDDDSSSSSAATSGLRLINYDGEYTATNPFRALQLNENLD